MVRVSPVSPLVTLGFWENFSSASEVGGSCALSAGEERRIGAPTSNAWASAGAFAASARTPGSRSLKSPAELTRKGRILGRVRSSSARSPRPW